jgi:hypothetical protein
MPVFTVHVPRDAVDTVSRAERTAFVRDSFSLAAFLFGPLYLMRHRAWLAAAAWIIVVAAGALLCHLLHLPGAASFGLLLLAMLFTGLEASSIRRFSLYRRGLEVEAVVGGRTLEDGERAFFAGEAGRAPMPVATGSPRGLRMAPTGVIGLFPDEGA